MVITDNCATIALDGSEIEIEFTQPFSYIWVENLGTVSIKMSRSPNVESAEQGVLTRPAKSSAGMSVKDSKLYVYGESGSINVMGTNSAENPFKIVAEGGGSGGSGGTTDYNDLSNKPKINGVTLSGNKSLEDLGIRDMTEEEVTNLINNAKGE